MNPLSRNVLVLNRDYLATRVISVKDAICILYKEQAQIITDYYELFTLEEWEKKSIIITINPEEFKKYKYIVSSPSRSFIIPKVIILNKRTRYIKELKNMRFSRKNVFLRDLFTCQYCGYNGVPSELTLDHITPKSKGGESSFLNLVTACKQCNIKKANHTLKESGMKLLKEPAIPEWRSFINKSFAKIKEPYWEKFL